MVHIDLRDARNGHINHSRSLKFKILSAVLPGACFLISLWPTNSWWAAGLIASLMTGLWFAFLFNGIWGLKIADDWFYRSTASGKNLSKFDKLVRSWPKWVYQVVTSTVTGAITTIYIKNL
jgi:hypothetical protein